MKRNFAIVRIWNATNVRGLFATILKF